MFSDLAVNLAFAATYFAVAELGLRAVFGQGNPNAIWPLSGIGLAALMTLGYRVAPGIFFGAFVVTFATTGAVAASVGIAIGHTLEGLSGAYLVSRFARGPNAFDRAQDLFKYVLLAAISSTALGATFAAASLWFAGAAGSIDAGSVWLAWWLGDAAGVLLVAPVLILWARQAWLGWKGKRLAEFGLLLASSILVSETVFGGLLSAQNQVYPLSFLCIPVLVWAALRFGQRETATAGLLITAMAVWGSLGGFGPFDRENPDRTLLLLQTYMSVIAVTAMALASSVRERRAAEEQIQASLREKDVLLKEVHHRVKNNLQIISSLLSLQARSVGEREVLEMFKECQNRIRCIALVHEELHRSEDLSRLDMARHLRSLVSYLCGSYGIQPDRIRFQMATDQIFLVMDAAIPCGLLVHELVSNALRHAFPPPARSGEIRVELRRAGGDRVAVVVADNGVGLPKDLDFRNAATLGLQLVGALTDQLGGSLELAGPPGTTYKVTFPVLRYGQRSPIDGNGAHPGR
jgi:two-component sensor histidine kinase/integral membrane sensor domain MASE1